MNFDIADYKRRAERLRWDDLDFVGFADEPLDAETLRCIEYMHDVELCVSGYNNSSWEAKGSQGRWRARISESERSGTSSLRRRPRLAAAPATKFSSASRRVVAWRCSASDGRGRGAFAFSAARARIRSTHGSHTSRTHRCSSSSDSVTGGRGGFATGSRLRCGWGFPTKAIVRV